MARTPLHSDAPPLLRQLEDAALAIRDGQPFPQLRAEAPADLAEVVRAFNEVLAAAAAREHARTVVADRNNEVLLALEELAREQAAEVARQNEELRRQNAELTRADTLKNEFLATVSHELRTPLNAVIGFSELLLEGIPGDLHPDQAEYVSDIHRAGQHLLGMINDILDLARFDAGRLDFHNEPLELLVPVREAEEIARALALKKQQTFELHAEGPVTCLGDPQRIRQIALNLMSNAVKFTPKQGRVSVWVRVREGMAELEVRDNGIGIAEPLQQFIFEAFRQIDGSDAREHAGTGLGLALVKKFSEAMGGTVSVRSSLGQGATFTVRLPLALQDGAGRPGGDGSTVQGAATAAQALE